MALCDTVCSCKAYEHSWMWHEIKRKKQRQLASCMWACNVRFIQCMNDGIVQFEWSKNDLSVRLIFNAHRWVMRSLGWLNNFMIKSETNPKRVRAWHNHQLWLKCLDNVGCLNFIIGQIIINRWLWKINCDIFMIVIKNECKWIMTATIQKSMNSSASSWSDKSNRGVD